MRPHTSWVRTGCGPCCLLGMCQRVEGRYTGVRSGESQGNSGWQEGREVEGSLARSPPPLPELSGRGPTGSDLPVNTLEPP